MFNVENTFQNHLSLISDGGLTRENASEIRSVRKNRSNCVGDKSRQNETNLGRPERSICRYIIDMETHRVRRNPVHVQIPIERVRFDWFPLKTGIKTENCFADDGERGEFEKKITRSDERKFGGIFGVASAPSNLAPGHL